MQGKSAGGYYGAQRFRLSGEQKAYGACLLCRPARGAVWAVPAQVTRTEAKGIVLWRGGVELAVEELSGGRSLAVGVALAHESHFVIRMVVVHERTLSGWMSADRPKTSSSCRR